MDGWDYEPQEATKTQRRCLYRFGIPHELVKPLTKDEAEVLISILVAASKRLSDIAMKYDTKRQQESISSDPSPSE